jgi:hypothetical protein
MGQSLEQEEKEDIGKGQFLSVQQRRIYLS